MHQETSIEQNRERTWPTSHEGLVNTHDPVSGEGAVPNGKSRKRKREPDAGQQANMINNEDDTSRSNSHDDCLAEEDGASDVDGLLHVQKTRRRLENSLGMNRAASALSMSDFDSFLFELGNRQFSPSLAHAILTSLPREIRDRIYSYVLGPQLSKVTVCDGKLPHAIRSRCNSMQSHHSLWELSDQEYYFDARRFGKTIAMEIAETYYKTKIFHFDYHELYLVHKLLRVDRFAYGFRPAELVRNIEVVLYADYKCSCNSVALSYYEPTLRGAISAEGAISACLEQLLTLKAGSPKIKFIVFLWVKLKSYERFVELLRIIAPFLQRFISLDFRVSFGLVDSFGQEWSIEDTKETPIDQALSKMIEVGTPFYLSQAHS